MNKLSQTIEKKLLFMSLILRVGWVWTLEKNVTKGSLQKKNKKCGFFPHLLDPPTPPKCGNTFWGRKIFLHFYPENDLPTHKTG